MRAIALGYHDVLEGSLPDASGFPGPSAARYKIEAAVFAVHMSAVAAARPAVLPDVRRLGTEPSAVPLILTFDDGGSGALAAADTIERHGWRGHFLITAGRVGTSGFLDRGGVRALRERGHLVGSHSWSHPARMSFLSPDDQRREWTMSIDGLSDMIGEKVDVGSVPGGYYDAGVGRAAASAGIRALFTSEPTARPALVDGCLVVGRYAIFRGTAPDVVAALAAGRVAPRARQAVLWNLKKAAKVVGGEYYLKLRRIIIARTAGP